MAGLRPSHPRSNFVDWSLTEPSRGSLTSIVCLAGLRPSLRLSLWRSPTDVSSMRFLVAPRPVGSIKKLSCQADRFRWMKIRDRLGRRLGRAHDQGFGQKPARACQADSVPFGLKYSGLGRRPAQRLQVGCQPAQVSCGFIDSFHDILITLLRHSCRVGILA